MDTLEAEWRRFRALRIASFARRGLTSGVVRAAREYGVGQGRADAMGGNPMGTTLGADQVADQRGAHARQGGLNVVAEAAATAAGESCGMDAVCEMRVVGYPSAKNPTGLLKNPPAAGLKREWEQDSAAGGGTSAFKDSRVAADDGPEVKRPRLVLERGLVFDGVGCLKTFRGSRKTMALSRTVSFSEELELGPTFAYNKH